MSPSLLAPRHQSLAAHPCLHSLSVSYLMCRTISSSLWNLSQPIACTVTISYNKEKRTEVRKRR